MSREDTTRRILEAKTAKGLRWSQVAEEVRQSKEWVTAGCLGQMTFNAEQADLIGEIFDLSQEDRRWLQKPPCRGSLPTPVPTDPLIYRFHELVSVYGTTLKELIHEEFGDGIMSAIDFEMEIDREPHPNGDRVRISMSGKFLPYKTY